MPDKEPEKQPEKVSKPSDDGKTDYFFPDIDGQQLTVRASDLEEATKIAKSKAKKESE